MKLYGDQKSGNCYKILLTAAWLEQPLEWVDVNIMQGATRTAEFMQKNPNGKIPLLEIEAGRYLAESNAIVNYLAWDTALLPQEKYLFSLVQQWQFFEQYSHEPYIAVARFINKYQGLPAERLAEYQAKQAGGHQALAVMEQQLATQPFLTGKQFTVADICLFAYTHVAHEGGFELAAYPAVVDWLERISKDPRFVPMANG